MRKRFAVKAAFGHSFLKNLSIGRNFLVVFAVLMVSLGAVALVGMSGMRGILATFDHAAGAYAASKLAGSSRRPPRASSRPRAPISGSADGPSIIRASLSGFQRRGSPAFKPLARLASACIVPG
ncbi:MAG TPA: hypothetical protein VFY95_08270 [Sphingomicrobium sp.]